MTRPHNPDSLEMTRRGPIDEKAARTTSIRAIGRNVENATPYEGDARTLEPDKPRKATKPVQAQSDALDARLAEATDAANAAQEGGRHPKAQLNPGEPDEPDTIERGEKAAPKSTRRDAGQSRTGEG
jgi:hypothetical protein